MGRTRLLRVVTSLCVALAAVVLVTAIADISVAPQARPAKTGPADRKRQPPDPRSDVANELEEVAVLEHEGGLADAESWLTGRVDAALRGLEGARLRTRELLPL